VQPLIFIRSNPDLPASPSLTLLLKPGVTMQYEDELLGVLEGVAPQWNFVISPWAKLRAAHIREYTAPLLLGGIVAMFLLVLVGCGMLGVLWQNVIRRMPEMGLRRAVGATAAAVRLQVVLELLAMACLALLAGFVIVVQLPLLGMWQILDWGLFIRALITSTLVLLAACALFALYPSYQATRRDPVDALRYE
jgi:putative ABC transport system permease protein